MPDTKQYQSLLLNTSVFLGNYRVGMERIKHRDVVIITDENVFKHYKVFVMQHKHIVIPAGEDSKSPEMLFKVIDQLVELEMNRDALILGFGGGVVTDFAGFVASIFKRGVDFVLMPTSLLAMVDASVGGKNGVNYKGIKNQIGCIRQPLFTWIDTSFLQSLDYLHFLNGLAELLKTALIFSKPQWDFLCEHREKLMKTNIEILQIAMADAVKNKLSVVEQDETDNGLRQILNFGHSFGHVIELSEHMLHGLAVSKGMVASLKLSVAAGYLSKSTASEIVRSLEEFGLPVNIDFKAEYFIEMQHDKKRIGKALQFVFLKEIGEPFIHKIELNELKSLAYDARNLRF